MKKKEKYTVICFKIPKSLKAAFDKIAKERNYNKSAVLRKLLESFVFIEKEKIEKEDIQFLTFLNELIKKHSEKTQ